MLVADVCDRVAKLQVKKADAKRDQSLRSERAKIYELIKPFCIGRFKMNPRHVHLPPEEVANKDFYIDLKEKIKAEWITRGEAFKCGDNLLCFFNVSIF